MLGNQKKSCLTKFRVSEPNRRSYPLHLVSISKKQFFYWRSCLLGSKIVVLWQNFDNFWRGFLRIWSDSEPNQYKFAQNCSELLRLVVFIFFKWLQIKITAAKWHQCLRSVYYATDFESRWCFDAVMLFFKHFKKIKTANLSNFERICIDLGWNPIIFATNTSRNHRNSIRKRQ